MFVKLRVELSQDSTELIKIASNGLHATFDDPKELQTSLETLDGVLGILDSR